MVTYQFLSLSTVDIWGLSWALQDIGSISGLYPLDTSCHNPKCLRHGPVFPGEACSTWIRVYVNVWAMGPNIQGESWLCVLTTLGP